MTLKSLLNHVGVDTLNGVTVEKRLPVKIYYDCEFREDGKTIDLISIGMVGEDGREYYAVNADCDWERVWTDPWLMEHVVPSIPTILEGSALDMYNPVVKTKDVIAYEVRDFILSYAEPALWAWYGSYDHVAYAQLFGRMIHLPEGLPMHTNDLKQECERLGNPRVPQQAEGSHNALASARHNKVIADFLRDIEWETANDVLATNGWLW